MTDIQLYDAVIDFVMLRGAGGNTVLHGAKDTLESLFQCGRNVRYV